ncbi:NAD(P)-binding protein [Staphylotrichum tortipilum]|uniref:NAD(P)-binding protein n=1 Tax=Staphylotrichum tortipilum TaxID=2831512 RepID=A0AAN6MM95_9PEZI|nr:NAD(P)-binding protein [Staphylotrichum longicolle]
MASYHPVILALAGVGAIVVLRSLHAVSQFLAFHLLTPAEPLKKYKRANATACALITGASAGIGLGIAQELVRQGFGVVLLGHLPDELEAAAASLRVLVGSAPPPDLVRTVCLDARTSTPEEMRSAVDALATPSYPITILVNNVGGNPVSPPAFRTHATYAAGDVDAVINQNARFMARLTALLLPRLIGEDPKARGGGGRSLVLTLSSAAHVGTPWLVMYGATKAFNRAFGAGLARELAADAATSHVDSLVVVPGEVVSQGNCRDVPAGSPRWDEFGKAVVRKVDGAVGRGWREMAAWWRHGVEGWLLKVVGEGVRTKGVTEQLGRKKRAWDGVKRE